MVVCFKTYHLSFCNAFIMNDHESKIQMITVLNDNVRYLQNVTLTHFIMYAGIQSVYRRYVNNLKLPQNLSISILQLSFAR